MSGKLAQVHRPRTTAELDSLVGSLSGGIAYVAGATDFLLRPERWASAEHLVDLNAARELTDTLEENDAGLLIGAAVPLSRLIENQVVRERYPLLAEACSQIGSVQIQNRATLGGNIANASPAGDTLPVLCVYDAELWLGPKVRGEYARTTIAELMTGPGLTTLDSRYIALVHLPRVESEGQFRCFRKVGQRYSLAISKLSLAVLGWRDGDRVRDIRVCAGSVSPVVKRAAGTESLLRGQVLTGELISMAAQKLSEEVSPISDIRSTVEYRRHICGALLADALHGARLGAEAKV